MKLTELINTEYKKAEAIETQNILQNKNVTNNLEKITTLFEKMISKKYGKSIGEDMYKKIAKWMKKEFIEEGNLENKNLKKSTLEDNTLINSTFDFITPEDITAFSLKLADYQDSKNFEDAGYFISVLINNHFKATQYKSEYKIITEHLEKTINGIGIYNCANIVVYGNVGDDFCIKMKNGTSTLYGNCKDYACIEMKNGTVNIFGNANQYLGAGMLNGKIRVEGTAGYSCAYSLFNGTIEIKENARNDACYNMYGGTVRLEGNDSLFADRIHGGKIYVNSSIYFNKPFITKREAIKKRKKENEMESLKEIAEEKNRYYSYAVYVDG